MVYDERLKDHDDPESLYDTADDIAAEMAEQHCEECYDHSICSACIRDTPLSREWGPWAGKANELDALADAVEERMRDMGEDPYWVRPGLAGTYIDTFRAAGVDPEDCDICNSVIVGEDEGCGHRMNGEPCPAGE